MGIAYMTPFVATTSDRAWAARVVRETAASLGLKVADLGSGPEVVVTTAAEAKAVGEAFTRATLRRRATGTTNPKKSFRQALLEWRNASLALGRAEERLAKAKATGKSLSKAELRALRAKIRAAKTRHKKAEKMFTLLSGKVPKKPDEVMREHGRRRNPCGSSKANCPLRANEFKPRPSTGARPSKLEQRRWSKVVDLFFELRTKAARIYGAKVGQVGLAVDPSIHNSPRHFAATGKTRDGIVVHIAPELLRESANVKRGVLAHELGHAVALLGLRKAASAKNYDAVERQADRLAEKIVGYPILYDKRGVELAGPRARGVTPRPSGLR